MPPSVLGGRVVGTGEPLWLQSDTDLAVALTELEASTCSGCGQPVAECMSTEGDGAYDAEPWRCHGCATRDRKAQEFSKAGDQAGIRWVVKRRGDGGGG